MRASAAAVAVAVVLVLPGCGGEPDAVDPAVGGRADATVASMLEAVKESSWTQACSQLTFEAKIEIEARIQRRQGLASRPSCADALAGPAFAALCGKLWGRTHLAKTYFAVSDVTEKRSEPTVAWAAVTRRERLTEHCEMRLTREDSDAVTWRVDAIALDGSQAVLRRDRYSLVYENGSAVATFPRSRG